ncbi:deaminase domain-containing protein [Capnocytophaga ochracea]|uniref:deaminase domain-containing protein n=2 Tax=Capnocytophaga TaxID=1016 RepID=UPI002B4A7635|nr:deaminase domain-containing protein [Capnocytophaga ochracea]MEB3016039.1 deaminase domain-containing protein [Capnocytophaga ochracea]MEB3035793.1 deaminase domain-containing protein [Capnocytophaga ochracea]
MDSEYKMLNRLANELGAEKGRVYGKMQGELKIISELEYCKSCTGIIQQFNEMFPNIKLILVDGVK